MPLGQHKKNAKNDLKVPGRGVVGWRKLAPIIKMIGEMVGVKISVEGMDLQEIDGGVHLKGKSGPAGGHPFKVTGEEEDGVIQKGLVFDGLTEFVPEVGGVPMEALQPLDISSGGVWLHVEWAPFVIEDEVHSGGAAVVVELVTTPGTGEAPTTTTNGHLYVHIWELDDGVSVQYVKTGLRVQYCAALGFVATSHGA